MLCKREVMGMTMAWIWTAMVTISVIYSIFTGRLDALGTAALEGAAESVKLCISMGGAICLWSGIMGIMNASGMSAGLSRALKPVLSKLYPAASRNKECMEALSANVSANILGLGNAATPLGIKAAKIMHSVRGGVVATDDLCMLVVMNTASIQIIPATVAGLRASLGAVSPFDILPAVWLSSLASVSVGVITAKILSRLWR